MRKARFKRSTVWVAWKDGTRNARPAFVLKGMFAVHKTEPGSMRKGWIVTHCGTGLKACVGRFTLAQARDLAGRLLSLGRERWDRSADEINADLALGRLAREAGRAVLRDADDADDGAPVSWTIDAVNRRTGATHRITVSEAEVRHVSLGCGHATCAGPCECGPMEPDAVCLRGWPSRTDVATFENPAGV